LFCQPSFLQVELRLLLAHPVEDGPDVLLRPAELSLGADEQQTSSLALAFSKAIAVEKEVILQLVARGL
jgi:hypothetical protein